MEFVNTLFFLMAIGYEYMAINHPKKLQEWIIRWIDIDNELSPAFLRDNIIRKNIIEYPAVWVWINRIVGLFLLAFATHQMYLVFTGQILNHP